MPDRFPCAGILAIRCPFCRAPRFLVGHALDTVFPLGMPDCAWPPLDRLAERSLVNPAPDGRPRSVSFRVDGGHRLHHDRAIAYIAGNRAGPGRSDEAKATMPQREQRPYGRLDANGARLKAAGWRMEPPAIGGGRGRRTARPKRRKAEPPDDPPARSCFVVALGAHTVLTTGP